MKNTLKFTFKFTFIILSLFSRLVAGPQSSSWENDLAFLAVHPTKSVERFREVLGKIEAEKGAEGLVRILNTPIKMGVHEQPKTILYYLTWDQENFEIVKLLIDAGAQLNVDGAQNPLVEPIGRCQKEMVEFLLQEGCEIDEDCMYAIDFLAFAGNLYVLEFVEKNLITIEKVRDLAKKGNGNPEEVINLLLKTLDEKHYGYGYATYSDRTFFNWDQVIIECNRRLPEN